MTSIKLKYGEDIRRFALGCVPSYAELMRLVQHAYSIAGDFTLKYEDDEFDLVTVSSDDELKQAAIYAGKTSGVLRFEVFDTGIKERLWSPHAMVLSNSQNLSNPSPSTHNINQLFDLDSLKRLFCNLEVSEFISKLKTFGWLNASQEQLDQLVSSLQAMITESALILKHSSGKIQDEEAVHEGVFCDGCQSKIVGVRYKCAFCFNYDLCARCEASGLHDASHPRVKMAKPVDGVIEQCAWNSQQCATRYNAQLVKTPGSDCINVPIGRSFVKTWKIRNNGSRSWPSHCSLSYVDGSALSAVEDVPILTCVPAGQQIDISVEMVAPRVPGRYQCFWCLKTPEGNFVGEKLWCDIVVHPISLPPMPSFVAEGPAHLMEHELKCIGLKDEAAVNSQGTSMQLKETEKESIKVLEDMGFTGDLLTVFRKNRGDIADTIHELIVE